MLVSSADTLRTASAGTAAAQPLFTNTAAANPLASLLFNMPGVNPLLAQTSLSSMNVPVLAAYTSGMADPNVQLANALSQLILGTASQPVNSMMPNVQPGWHNYLAAGGAFGLPGLTQQGLLGAAIQQSVLSAAGSNTSLLSPADQQQLLRNAGLLPAQGQAATPSSGTSGIHSSTSLNAGQFPPSSGAGR